MGLRLTGFWVDRVWGLRGLGFIGFKGPTACPAIFILMKLFWAAWPQGWGGIVVGLIAKTSGSVRKGNWFAVKGPELNHPNVYHSLYSLNAGFYRVFYRGLLWGLLRRC